MEKKSDNEKTAEWLKEIPLRTESEGFATEEMISCKKCKRNNPPNRLQCLYCGVALEFDASQSQFIKPVLRKAEAHANGYNLIYLADLESWDEKQFSEITKMTRRDKSTLQRLVESGKSLPIARSETEKETEIVSERLKEVGIKTTVLPDEAFEMDSVSRRLRRIDFEDEKLILVHFNNDEVVELNGEDLSLLVVGGLFERRLESTEKHKKKGENKVLETSEISSDERVIDIYSNDSLISFRVSQSGFDFSSLGDEKSVLALENMENLIVKLREFSTKAKFDDEYLRIRDCLADIWQVEEKSDSKGMKRQSFGSFNRFTEIKTSNLLQFTKYSRLQWLLLNFHQNIEGQKI